ncbi:hypothetical protein G6O67_006420 [Ophiocordyceps sinensis]|uniref:Secreted protein n=1 Tax=Ophiocordyceps sinensis TaxID=72228 RepID=A0A8H4LVL6_9HYPO|nr:hypothetical protein G6O67_006420 [Ophiocordyceps sinensis]
MKASLFYCVALCVPGILSMTTSVVPHARPRVSRRDPAEGLTQKVQLDERSGASTAPDTASVSRRGGSLRPRSQRLSDLSPRGRD